MAALARLQLNVMAEKNNGFGYFDNIQEERVVLPFAWLEEGVLGPSEVKINVPVERFLRTVLAIFIILLYLRLRNDYVAVFGLILRYVCK